MLTTTFSDPRERGKAFGVYGAIAGGGGLVGLLLGGVLTEYLNWRWCLYVNLLFAGLGAAGAAVLLQRHRRGAGQAQLDIIGVVLGSASMFCLVYGFANASTHNWHTPSTWGFIAAGVVLLVAFAIGQARVAHPLLPPRVVLDRNRGGAYLTVFVVGAAMFGLFLFLTFYMQTTLGYSPVVTGLAFVPAIAMLMLFAQISNIVLMPRIGPKPLIGFGLLIAAGGMAWLTRIGVHSSYVSAVLGPLLLSGVGLGLSDRAGLQHRNLWRRGQRRRRRLGHAQRRPAARRIDRNGAAQHHRHQRGSDVRRQPSEPRDGGLAHGQGGSPCERGRARLHHCVLVDGGYLRRRRRRLRSHPAKRPAGPRNPSARQRPRRREIRQAVPCAT